jgi:hypothetical protein
MATAARMHHDVTANSLRGDELTAALLLRQELEHVPAQIRLLRWTVRREVARSE